MNTLPFNALKVGFLSQIFMYIFAFTCVSVYGFTFADVITLTQTLPDPMDIVEESGVIPVVSMISAHENINQAKNLNTDKYRRCEIISDDASFETLVDNIRCEGFYFSRSAFSHQDRTISRRNASVLALSMMRTDHVLQITPPESYKNIQKDITSIMFPWTRSIVETDLDYALVTPLRDRFEPSRPVTRSEAFSFVMASICMYPKFGRDEGWQMKLHEIALREGMTVRTWENFSPNTPISAKEMALLVTRAANWATGHGACGG